jgi:MFS family permease
MASSVAWYDFFLYGSASALVFPQLFLPRSDRLAGLLVAFATYGLGFAARPVGGALFGHLGDRIGRRATLIATLLLIGVATAAIAAVPGYAAIGIWGGVLLTLLRILQGIGIGGEWAGSVLLAMEWGSNRRRGLVASWPQVGLPLGLILGSGALPIFSALSGPAFLSWGWRIPFLLALAPLLVGVYLRLGVQETPTYKRLFEERRIELQPVAEVFAHNFKEILLSALIRVPEQAPFYVFTAFVLSRSVVSPRVGQDLLSLTVLGAAALSLVAIPLSGYLSDRIGRRRMYVLAVALVGIYAFPYFMLLNTAVLVLVVLAVALSLVPLGLQSGTQAALIAESFTGRRRYSGASIGYQLGSAIAGASAPVITAALVGASWTWMLVAGYLVLCALIGLGATLLMPGRASADHTREYDAATVQPQPATGQGLRPARS